MGDYEIVPPNVDGWAATYPPAELAFQLPSSDAFKTVNGAVFYTLTRLSENGQAPHEAVDGGTLYHVWIHNAPVRLFVLHVTEYVAVVRFHWLRPTDPARFERWRQSPLAAAAQATAGYLLGEIETEIGRLLRLAVAYGGQAPPPPPATDIRAVLMWQRMYYPAMNDTDLGALVGLTRQTIANARSQLSMHKRTPRGKRKAA